ncbi:phage tail assembly chaperone [Brevundimonas sp.]|uniref:phage tail assembly chaperone n=1 Tax=Brevundimonas sp. TaxID=1871086 RepID=UPI002D34D0BA|nr:phage tail assembly chaperone [Brevundimonas sp.]HYC96507.1 phage tail assembly chaperone [Brevundimonas sp.]
MLRAAAGLGVDPEAFWRLSLKEWRMLMEAPETNPPMRRSEFERMAETWPDD